MAQERAWPSDDDWCDDGPALPRLPLDVPHKLEELVVSAPCQGCRRWLQTVHLLLQPPIPALVLRLG